MGRSRRRNILPGFGLSSGITLGYLSLLVLIPLSAAFLRTAVGGWEHFWTTVTAPRLIASYKLTLGASLGAALINALFGLLVPGFLHAINFLGRASLTRWLIFLSHCLRPSRGSH